MKSCVFLICLLFTKKLFADSEIGVNNITPRSSCVVESGNIILAGFNSNGSAIMKIDLGNNIVWSKSIQNVNSIEGVNSDNDAVYFFGGMSIGKINFSGNLIWSKETGTNTTVNSMYLNEVENKIFYTSVMSTNIYISCLDTSGFHLWTRSIPNTPFSLTADADIVLDSANNVYVIFENQYNLNIAKFSTSGNLLLHNEYSYSPFHINMLNSTTFVNGTFIINGLQENNHAFYTKVDTSGIVMNTWESIPDTSTIYVPCKLIYNNGYYYQFGFHDDAMSPLLQFRFTLTELDSNLNFVRQIDIGNWGNYGFPNSDLVYSNSEFYLTRIDEMSLNGLVFHRFMDMNNIVCESTPTNMNITNLGNPFTLSSYSVSNIVSNPFSNINLITSNIACSISQRCPQLSVEENYNSLFFLLYPNPNNGTFTVNYNLGENISNGSFKVYDAIGKLVYDEKLIQNSGTLNFHLLLVEGVYFWEVRDDDKNLLRRNKMVVVH